MEEQDKHGDISFRVGYNPDPILIFKGNGDIIVRGELVGKEDDKKVADTFREFLRNVHNKNVEEKAKAYADYPKWIIKIFKLFNPHPQTNQQK